ncbi:PorP/SprF family type IX secretion system membrane protein [Flavicella sediminum]|uniref:PorP/SprF family type IX secretion system membrane protein n=1 Tax=Flavicella sediminum TaxID=2585141 RepID=UPI001124081D|nr:type IX secretion system membrane protein PorP/SprF [Flavicella sediminum]
MKKYKLLLAVFMCSLGAIAQETAPSFLSYKYNMNILNPAYAGAGETAELNIGFRKASLGLQDDPVTQMLSYSKALKNNLGIGLSVVNDKIHVVKQTDVAIDISYKLQLNRTDNLFFGMKVGGAMHAIDFNSLGIENDNVFGENVSEFNPLVGFGAYLKGERYSIHLSTPNLLLSGVQKPLLDEAGNSSSTVKEKLHVYLGGDYRFAINRNVDFIPSVFARIVEGIDPMIDMAATVAFMNKMEAGITYRVDTSIIGSVFFKLLDNTHFGYAYEYATSDFSNVSNGTHEFVLRFKFN